MPSGVSEYETPSSRSYPADVTAWTAVGINRQTVVIAASSRLRNVITRADIARD